MSLSLTTDELLRFGKSCELCRTAPLTSDLHRCAVGCRKGMSVFWDEMRLGHLVLGAIFDLIATECQNGVESAVQCFTS